MLAVRDSKSSEELDLLSSRIMSRVLSLQEVIGARTISTYVTIGSEVRTGSIIKRAQAQGKRVIIPVTDRVHHQLRFSEVRDPDAEFQLGTFGIPEPKPAFVRFISPEEAEVVLVPGVAWDLRGYRIGYGGGYYDKTIDALSGAARKVGLAYEFQIVDTIPEDSFDRRVDRVVTESRVVETRGSLGGI